MPAIIPFIPLIAAGVSAGVPLIEKAVAGGGDPNADLQKQIAAAQAQQKSQQDVITKEAIARQAPSLQAQLGGAVAPEYYISESAREVGAAGSDNLSREALTGFLGLSGEGPGGVTPATTTPGAATSSLTPGTPAPGAGAGSNVFEELLSKYFPGGGGGVGGAGGPSMDTGTTGGYV